MSGEDGESSGVSHDDLFRAGREDPAGVGGLHIGLLDHLGVFDPEDPNSCGR